MRIACVHIPRFAVEVERQRRHDLAVRLILVGDATVFDCSLGADASGVRRGMRMSEAIGLSHRAVVLPPDQLYYQRRFDEVLDFLEGFSPAVEAGDPSAGSGRGLGTAFLSLDGLSVDRESFADGLIASLHRQSGLMASVGIADGKFAARVAAQTTRPGLAKVVPSGQEAAFLSPIDVSLLPCSRDTLRHLELFGLRTMGDVAALPLGAVQAQFGAEGRRIWELAQGIDREPLRPLKREESVREHLAFYAPLISREALVTAGRQLLARLLGQPAMRGRAARRMTLRALLSDGRSWERAVVFREASADREQMLCVLKSAIEGAPLTAPIEELAIELSGFAQEMGKQQGFFSSNGRQRRQVAESIRQLKARYGRSPVLQILEVEPWSRIPERRHALIDYDL
jgi:nucleotidyltransferase/DNA polymerase involved in DNA repair